MSWGLPGLSPAPLLQLWLQAGAALWSPLLEPSSLPGGHFYVQKLTLFLGEQSAVRQ